MNKFIIENNRIIREVDVSKDTVNRDERDIESFCQQLSSTIPFDTGLIPPGLFSYRQAGEYSQMVIQQPPAVNYINWSEREGGPHKIYCLAQPWRLLIADLRKGNLLGARMFYSPVQISHPDQPLYLQNVPNINTRGYGAGYSMSGRLGIGWVCLYLREDWSKLMLSQRVARVIQRCSGQECYNNANMRETDGTRYYQSQGKPRHLWDPITWEKKTEKEGIGWTLDPDLWIPVRINGIDDQQRQNEKGVPLTLHMAMVGNTSCYYSDKDEKKFPNRIARSDHTTKPEEFTSILSDAFGRTKQLKRDVIKTDPPVAKLVAEKVVDIAEHQDGNDMDPDEVNCYGCGDSILVTQAKLVPEHKEPYCDTCFEISRLCSKCGSVVQEYYETQELHTLCFACVSWCEGCGRPFAGDKNEPCDNCKELELSA